MLCLPVALIANDVLQILVALYVFGAYDVAGLLDHLLGKTYLACYLDGEGRPRSAYSQLEESFHLVAVVEHSTVGHTLMTVGKMLQVLIVRGNDSIGTLLAEAVEHSFGDSSAYARFGACTKLIDEDDGVAIGSLHHILHVEQMRGVGTEVVLQTLFVAYVDHDVLEHARLRTLAHGDAQSALQHVLQQSHGLQTYRLSSGVRT